LLGRQVGFMGFGVSGGHLVLRSALLLSCQLLSKLAVRLALRHVRRGKGA
jgi:hypothetical protein